MSARARVALATAALLALACTPSRRRDPGSEAQGSGPQVHGWVKVGAGKSLSVGPAAQTPKLAPADLTSDFEVPEGLAVTLWAESPQLQNPTAIDVDARGRVWVTEAVNYRQWSGRNPGRHHDAGDRVMILEDSDGDGACDRSRVFVQDADLVSPLGIAVLGDAANPKRTRVVVSCSPSIFIWTDEDGDDVPDKKEVFLTGFGGKNHDHGVHSVVVGPDGRWYFAVGNAGPHIVTDKSGWTLRSGSIYRGGGEHEADNHPGLMSDDGRVWVGGLILRCEPDGTKLTVMAHNFRNEYEVALDSFGNMFTADNDDDGSACCRTTWVMEGGNYGYFSADGSREWPADRRPGQDVWTAHWHQDDPGVCPAGTRNGAGGPTGVCVYEGDLVPQMSGRVLNADAGANVVYAHAPVTKGAGIELEPGKLIASRPQSGEKKDRWFRPSDVCVQTDGSILVADWWDPGVGGHLAGDKEAYGRILRIAPKGHRPSAPKIDVSTVDGAIEALENPAVHVRSLARAALATADAKEALTRLHAGDDGRLRARSLWLLAGLPLDESRSILRSATQGPEADLRIAAIRAMRVGEHDSSNVAALVPAIANDAAPSVRREAALALSYTDRPTDKERARDGGSLVSSQRALLSIVESYPGSDPWLLEAFGMALREPKVNFERSLMPEVLEHMRAVQSSARELSPAIAEMLWRLHPRESIHDLALHGKSAHLPIESRRRMLDALAFTPEREAGETMLHFALAGPEDTRALAAWWVEHNDLDLWRDFHLAQQLGSRGIEDAEMRWSSGILTAASRPVDVDVDVAGAKHLWLVVTEGKTGNSCDWVDWIEPVFAGPAGDVRLTSLDWASVKAAWGETHENRNAVGGPLKLDGVVLPDGIGTHARSEIVYRIPDGVTRFRARAVLDDGGTQQGGAPDVEFQVWTDRARDPKRWEKLAAPLVEASAKAEDVEVSAKAMASDREGGLALIRLAAGKKLTPKGVEAVARFVFANPDLSVRALASEHFPRASASGAPLPPLAELAKIPGDASRGSKIFFGTAASCSTCHSFYGKGGDVGPDLSSIVVKYGKPELLDAILNPSAAIAHGYEAWMIETQDGVLHNGFVLSEGASVVIKDTSGRRHVIPADEIASKAMQKVSTMPDNVAMGLGAQELADLVRFLSENPRTPGRRLAKRSLFDGKDLAGWTSFLGDPSAREEYVWVVEDGVLHCTGTPIGYLRTKEDFTSFVLTLEWRFDPALPPGNSGVLLRMTGEDKVWPKSIEAQLHHRNAGDIWNIDAVSMEVDPARTNGRRTQKRLPCNEKPLGEWNRYVITLDGGELTLEVNGEVQNTARWCDEVPGKICLQSEGAAIQFRSIEITPIER